MKNLSFVNKIFFFFNIVAVATLFLSYLSYYISPSIFWPIAFFSLVYTPIAIINLFFIIFWLVQFKKQLLLSLVSLLMGYNYLNRTFATNNKVIPTPSDSTSILKIMSYNVRLFDLYDWIDKNESKSKILNLIKNNDPEIVCFQEFYHSTDKKPFITKKEISKHINLSNYHIENTTTLRKTEHWGIATYTKYPIVNKGKITFSEKENNICIYTDIKVKSDTIRIYNLHMASIGFAAQDYRFMDDLIHNKETNEIDGTKGILRRLKRAFLKRTKQADIIASHIQQCSYKVIVCGDFNDTSCSYAYRIVKNDLVDAFSVSGNGFGQTYIGKLPSFRIDYILHSPTLYSYEFLSNPEELSDHHTVSCLIEIKH